MMPKYMALNKKQRSTAPFSRLNLRGTGSFQNLDDIWTLATKIIDSLDGNKNLAVVQLLDCYWTKNESIIFGSILGDLAKARGIFKFWYNKFPPIEGIVSAVIIAV
jgi:hypothetical protein